MAGGTWDKLEQVFEDRVARALSKLGVYTQNDVQRLAERVDALSEAVNELIKATGVKPKRRPPASRRPEAGQGRGALGDAHGVVRRRARPPVPSRPRPRPRSARCAPRRRWPRPR